MQTTDSVTLAELIAAAEYADQQAEIHRPRCRARANFLDCASCDWHEDRVWKTDRALRHHFSQLQEGAA